MQRDPVSRATWDMGSTGTFCKSFNLEMCSMTERYHYCHHCHHIVGTVMAMVMKSKDHKRMRGQSRVRRVSGGFEASGQVSVGERRWGQLTVDKDGRGESACMGLGEVKRG